jgi:adenylylsulfate kinase-like enzyme
MKQSNNQKGCVLLATGLSGSGKTTILDRVKELLDEQSIPAKRLDGDIGRKSFSSNLGFTLEDRKKNHERAASVASFLKLEGFVVLCSYIAPNEDIRNTFSEICGGAYILHIDCPIEECKKRDPKGMYGKVVDGMFLGNPFTGLHPDATYSTPEKCDLVLSTNKETIEQSAAKVVDFLQNIWR